ncbi:tRNA lysidine(34) synthetase TilS [Oceanobacillus piezotolerans]|uniref:tRNA(Ile)-lysidine synthase n=1 Tax=Oceanobacillus piezotolerans TaxID=2448030 RepID=A0A498DE61_9BACI|nr:tRNA lysidine(34) synthetase TilS [Oceanobacillus piezotolerans]RLL41669.1 tRNA lysidine(34) synthetase TilS [Oceanobacillus piezotolerans]
MKQRVLEFIQHHQLLSMDDRVLIGVSGGPDSMALLHFFNSIRQSFNLSIIALSIDHQLRGESSKEDLRYVKEICGEWNIPFIGQSLDVPLYMEENQLGTEVAARELRYQFFGKQMEVYKGDKLVLGHHGDDQIETMLMRLTRSASSSNLSGIPVRREFHTGEIIRPFLCITKDEILTYCQSYQIKARTDESNFDTRYTRNYFRQHVLPLLKRKNSNLHQTIQQLSETLNEDEAFLQKEARKLVENVVKFEAGQRAATFDINTFLEHDQALQRRAFHLILNYLYKNLPKYLSYVHEEQFLSLLKHSGNIKIDFPLQLKVEKSYNTITLRFLPENPKNHAFQELLPVPGKVILPDGDSLTAVFADEIRTNDVFTYYCNLKSIELPLRVRTRKPGDRMTWKGLNGTKKVKDIFIDYKVANDERGKWPIVVDNKDQVLWLIGLKKGQVLPKGEEENEGPWIKLQYEKGS